jgi:hypothetical protein
LPQREESGLNRLKRTVFRKPLPNKLSIALLFIKNLEKPLENGASKKFDASFFFGIYRSAEIMAVMILKVARVLKSDENLKNSARKTF